MEAGVAAMCIAPVDVDRDGRVGESSSSPSSSELPSGPDMVRRRIRCVSDPTLEEPDNEVEVTEDGI
jgi:hypothetical protein